MRRAEIEAHRLTMPGALAKVSRGWCSRLRDGRDLARAARAIAERNFDWKQPGAKQRKLYREMLE